MRGGTDWVAAGLGRRTAAIAAACGVSLLVLSAGCGRGRVKPLITSNDPSRKIPGIVQAVEESDLPKARQMVKDLASDDAAIRLYAIGGLRRLTGETFGYNYYDDEAAREPAVKRWHQWLASQELAN